mgnify:FL=1
MKKLMIILLCINIYFGTFAEPAYPIMRKVIQPNGDSISISLHGDEYASWYENDKGDVIALNNENCWVYVSAENGNKILTNQIVSQTSMPVNINRDSVFNFIHKKRINNYLEGRDVSEVQINTRASTGKDTPLPTTGVQKILTVLVQFPDVKFQNQTGIKNLVTNMMNQSNYKHPGQYNITGSLRDFYLQASYNQLDIRTTVIGPYTVSHNKAYYGDTIGNKNDIRPQELAKEVMEKIVSDIDVSQFDNNNDGWVECIHILFAGYAQNDIWGYGDVDDIWPHMSLLLDSVSGDGVKMSRYIMTPELNGAHYRGVGTICHELGHILGAPDFYNSENDNFKGTGQFDLMASGSWNGDIFATSPAQPNPYIKTEIFGWTNAIELSGNDKLYTLRPSELRDNSIYKLSTSTSGEYYLLENRQQKHLPGKGLIIYHVNSDIEHFISTKEVNASHPQNLYVVDASNNLAKPTGSVASYDTINSPNAPFKSTNSKNIYFTSTSLPSNCAWNGTPTQNKDVCFISEEMVNGEMCIIFVLNPAIEGPDVLCDSAIYSLKHVPSNATIEWTYVGAGNVSNSGTPFYITSGQGTKNARYKRGSVLKNVIDIPGPVNPFPWAPLNQTAEPLALKSVPYEGTGTIKVNITFNGETYTLTKDVYMPGTVEIDDLGLGLSNPWIAGTRKVFTLASPTDIPNYSDVKWDVNIVGGNSFSSYGASVAITPSSNVTTVSITATYTQGCDGNNSHTITIPVTTRPSLSFTNPASGSVEISVVEGNNAETQQTMSISQSAPYIGAYRLELWHDVYGKVRELDVPENTPTITMNLDGLNSGVYVLRLIINNQIVETSQLIIK